MIIVCGKVSVIGIRRKNGIDGIKIGIGKISIVDGIKEVCFIRWENVNVRRVIVNVERGCDVGIV